MSLRLAPFAVMLLALTAPGAGAQSLGQTGAQGLGSADQSAVDCADPTNARAAVCQTDVAPQGTVSPRQGGLDPAMAARQAMQQPTRGAYTDATPATSENAARTQNGAALVRPESPEPLSEFQKFISSTDAVVLPVFGANLFTNAPSTFAPAADQDQVTPDYLLGPGDELRVHIWGQVNFDGAVRIDRSGDIYLPQVGAVHVAGLPYGAAEQHVRTAVARMFRNFQLTVDMGRLRGLQIFVVGQVRHPGSYTVSAQSTLLNALFASGGPTIQGSLRHVQLKREGKVVSDLDLYDVLLAGDKSKDTPLMSGDVVFVPAVGPQVAIFGSVHHPAIYELGTETTAARLLEFAGGPTALAAPSHISVERLDGAAGRLTFEIGMDAGALSGATLRDGDILRVLSVTPAYQQTVTLRGNTANPGRFTWHAGMHVSELIPDRESLLTRNYWWQRTRLGLPAPQFEPDATGSIAVQPRYPVDLSNCPALDGLQATASAGERNGNLRSPGGQDPCLQTGAPERPAYTQGPGTQQNATLPGTAVNSAPDASLATGANSLRDPGLPVDAPAAGVTRTEVKLPAPEIDWDYAVVERLDRQTLKTSLLPFNLGRLVLDHDATQDLALQAGDVISIFSQADIRVPLNEQTKFVRLEGEVASAGVYSAQPGETLRQLLQRAGGVTPNAYLYGATFTRESARKAQQQRLDEYVRTLQLANERGSLQATAAGVQSPAAMTAGASGQRNLISFLSQVRASGRIVFDTTPGASAIDALPDLALEDGDRFIIPAHPAVVNVIGAVYNQNAFLFEPGREVKEYLRLAGSATEDADQHRSFIVRANGSVVSRQTLGARAFATRRLNPGDTIVIPEKSLRPNGLRSFAAYTQMFSQLAFGAAAISVLQ